MSLYNSHSHCSPMSNSSGGGMTGVAIPLYQTFFFPLVSEG